MPEPLLVRAARREPVERTPVWFMRQAGRSLPEYRKLRERWTLQDIVAQPELCAEVTLQPVRRLGVDAAVMFADIMLPVGGMGILKEEVAFMVKDPPISRDPLPAPTCRPVSQVMSPSRISFPMSFNSV